MVTPCKMLEAAAAEKVGSLLWMLWPERLTKLGKLELTTLPSLSGRNFVWKKILVSLSEVQSFSQLLGNCTRVTHQEPDPCVWGQPQWSCGISQQLLWTWAPLCCEFTETAAYQLAWVTASTFLLQMPEKVGCWCILCLPIVNIPSDILQNKGE